MNKIEKRFKSFLASVCVFAFLCFGSTSVVALESSGSIKNIGWYFIRHITARGRKWKLECNIRRQHMYC